MHVINVYVKHEVFKFLYAFALTKDTVSLILRRCDITFYRQN